VIFLGVVPTFVFLHDSQGVAFQFMTAVVGVPQDKVKDEFRWNSATGQSTENTTGRDSEKIFF
jgi:hypothetical protein